MSKEISGFSTLPIIGVIAMFVILGVGGYLVVKESLASQLSIETLREKYDHTVNSLRQKEMEGYDVSIFKRELEHVKRLVEKERLKEADRTLNEVQQGIQKITFLPKSPTSLSNSPPTSSSPTAEVLSEWDIISAIRPDLYRRLAERDRPGADGALGTNRQKYFSVVFQRAATQSITHGVLTGDVTLVGDGVKALEYAFVHQNADGSFQFMPPAEFADKPVSPGDRASAAAFFYSELGHSLLLLQNSKWFQENSKTASLRTRVSKVIERANTSLSWLMGQESILKEYDRRDTNRLFFDAMAFYLTGKALGRANAVQLGESFIRMGLGQQTEQGFFVEKEGYDSSYQGVSNLRILFLFVNLDPQARELKEALWESIKRAAEWELTRVLPNGEVSTEGNTRVYPGGEKFLGKEKGIAFVDIALGFYYYSILSGEEQFSKAAARVLAFYSS